MEVFNLNYTPIDTGKNKNIYYDGGELNIPSREDFSQIGDEFIFMPVDVIEPAVFEAYCLIIYGTDINGNKIGLEITGLKLYIDVRPNGQSIELTQKYLRELCQVNTTEIKHGRFLSDHYVESDSPYVRIYARSMKDRKKYIEVLKKAGFQTASDEKSNYHRKILRDLNLSAGTWITASKYIKVVSKYGKKCDYYKANYTDVRNIEIKAVDRSIVQTWDIETITSRNCVPEALGNESTDFIFMICASFHLKDSEKSLINVCITDVDCEPCDDWITIVCKNEKEIIEAYGKVIGKIKPDYIIGFNDSSYDWTFLLDKIKYHKLIKWFYNTISMVDCYIPQGELESSIYTFNRKLSRIKLGGGKVDADCDYLKVQGIIPIDIRISFMKMAEKSKFSNLRYYLALNNLGNKVDLPIKTMWNDYRQKNLERCRNIAYYCMVDAIQCQRLQLVRSIIADHREVANLVFITVYDNHYYANGMKVCNLTAYYAAKENLLISTAFERFEGTEKYGGAYVFDPIKGLNNRRPIAGLDFASLYPSVMMDCNLSMEKMCKDEALVNRLKEKGIKVKEHKAEYEGKPVRSWSVCDSMGLYPKILIDLKAKRKKIKAIQLEMMYVLEFVEAHKDNYENGFIIVGEEKKELVKKYFDYKTAKADFVHNLHFDIKCLKLKQEAIKLIMNTFYGVAGNKDSYLFMLELALAVTTNGKKYILHMADFVRKLGFTIKYGDTDSLYLECPDHVFAEVDELYNSGKIDRLTYCTRMCEISMVEFDKLTKQTDAELFSLTGSKYLSMAYEEVLFPSVLTGKKKYAGLKHEGMVNFVITKYNTFIRGLEFIKEGQTKFCITICEKILNRVLDYNNTIDIYDIVLDEIKKAINHKWDISDFVQAATYRSYKQNVSVQTFVKRMKLMSAAYTTEEEDIENRLYKVPENGDKFEYLVVEPKSNYDFKGNKITHRKGDMMEYVDVVKKFKLNINLNFYIYRQLIGTCARFINFKYEGDDKEQQKLAIKDLNSYVAPLLKVDESLNKYKSNMLKMKFRYMSKLLCYDELTKFMFNGTFKYTSLTSNNLIDETWDTDELNLFWDKVLKRTDSDKIINDSESDEDEMDGKDLDYEDSKMDEINTVVKLVMPIADKYEVYLTRAMEHEVSDIDEIVKNPQLYNKEINEIKKICDIKFTDSEVATLKSFQVMFESFVANYGKV